MKNFPAASKFAGKTFPARNFGQPQPSRVFEFRPALPPKVTLVAGQTVELKPSIEFTEDLALCYGVVSSQKNVRNPNHHHYFSKKVSQYTTHKSGSKEYGWRFPGPKIAHFSKNWQFLLFIGSDFLLEIQFLAIFGQYSFQQYFLAP